ncbi:MAG TPA: hypothetical protein VFY45_06420 [Baekduia sp.]|nr:hypothetical protein [Baekduia sp.]
MRRSSIARKTWINSPFRGATDKSRLLGVLVAALTMALGAPTVALGAVEIPAPTLTGTAGDNGWFTSEVTVKWAPSGATVSACGTQTLTTDTAGTPVTCTASDDTSSVTRTVTVHLDKTPPTAVGATPARPPDVGPFYTAPLPIAWSAIDSTSGIAACTALTYSGPDGPAAAPAGTCRDRAGNISAPLPLTFNYDTTAPTVADLLATVGADRMATLRWTPGADAQTVSVVRRPGDGAAATRAVLDGPATTHEVLDGPLTAGMTYTYSVTVRDAAGNAATASAMVTAPAATVIAASQAGAKAKAKAKAKRPTLTWRARPKVKYYNLQLFRNGHKILSAWPTVTHYTLKASWRYRGHTYKLAAGRYRWYVWPGYGPRAAHRYGRLLTKGAVTVPKS